MCECMRKNSLQVGECQIDCKKYECKYRDEPEIPESMLNPESEFTKKKELRESIKAKELRFRCRDFDDTE